MADPHADVEEISSNRYASLVRSSTGYRVVHQGGTIQDRFPLTDDGSDSAWDRYRALTRVGRIERALGSLVPIAIVSASLWITITILGVVVSLRSGTR